MLCYGRILATGTPDEIRSNQAVIEAYLGTEHHAGARRMSAAVIEVDDLDVYYGTSQILFGVGLVGAAGRDHGAARPQRRRQIARP